MNRNLPQTIAKHPFLRRYPMLRTNPLYWGMEDDLAENLGEMMEQHGLTISEDDQMLLIEADMPGIIDPDKNIELIMEQGILWIKGERRFEEKDKEKKFYSKATSSYSYRVSLPSQIDENAEPDASYRDGILKIAFKKNKKAQAKRIAVQKK